MSELDTSLPAGEMTRQAAPRRLQRSLPTVIEKFGLEIALVAVIALFGSLRPAAFLTWQNFSSMFGSQSVLVILTLALLVALRTGDTDLSIGGVAALAGMIVAVLNVHHGWPVGAAIALALAAGLLVGLINGGISIFFGIDSFVVTLGTQTLLQGIVLWISNDLTIAGVSNSLVKAVYGTQFLGISVSFWYGVAVCVLLWYVFEHTSLGVRMLFVGRSREVARLSGIRVPLVRIGALAATSTLAAVAGVVYTGTTGSADPSSAFSFLLPAFAGCFLGATTLKPGQFNAWGSFIAVYFLVIGITGLAIYGAAAWVQPAFYGGALVVSVMLSRLSRRRTEQQLFVVA